MNEADEKKALIAQMGSKDNEQALTAVEALREKGWLTDGSLEGANLSGANLRGADLFWADLEGANLSGANLIRTNLFNANLKNADLFAANLSVADLEGAIVTEADLGEANLFRADLFRADLDGANLDGANLQSANLTGADLGEANLANSVCVSTVFADIDLSTVKGLGTIRHHGPSTVGVDTLYNSKGKIPEVFLRGCGVSENLISYLSSLTGKGIDFYSCFISYSHNDKTFARRVHDTLQGRGIRCWLDEHEMVPGDDIYDEVNLGIRYWDKVLVCCSVHSLRDSQWVDKEVKIALRKEERIARERKKEGQPYQRILALIPLNLDDYLFDDQCQSATGEELRGRMAANFTGWEHDNALFEREMEKVVRALRPGGGKAPPPEPKL